MQSSDASGREDEYNALPLVDQLQLHRVLVSQGIKKRQLCIYLFLQQTYKELIELGISVRLLLLM